MHLTAPLVFQPIFAERVWGGRRLKSLYGKQLPDGATIGESWEVVDRTDAQSLVREGPLKGVALHELWQSHRETLFGAGLPRADRFPLLCKLLDAQDWLSIQVHPPAEVAASRGGEPKEEMWYIMAARPQSELCVGLKRGATREQFERTLHDGDVAAHVHRLTVQAGDAMHVPCGRLHAIGAGNLIAEIQQNSDTTYRVFDWNRAGIDGRPRALHIEDSLASMDFQDIEPQAVRLPGEGVLAAGEHFRVERWQLEAPRSCDCQDRFAIFTVTDGAVVCGDRAFTAGNFFLVPRGFRPRLQPLGGQVTLLRTTIPS